MPLRSLCREQYVLYVKFQHAAHIGYNLFQTQGWSSCHVLTPEHPVTTAAWPQQEQSEESTLPSQMCWVTFSLLLHNKKQSKHHGSRNTQGASQEKTLQTSRLQRQSDVALRPSRICSLRVRVKSLSLTIKHLNMFTGTAWKMRQI